MLEGDCGNDPCQRLALQALLTDTDHGGHHRPRNRKQSMEIRIQGDDDSALFCGELQNGWVACRRHSDVTGMCRIMAGIIQVFRGAAR